jgi:hypothetical protein
MRGPWLAITSVATLLLLAGNVALWVERNIAHEERFVATTRDVLDEPEVQRALARRIVNQMLADQPVLRTILGGQSERAVSTLIGSEAFDGVLDYVAEHLYAMSITGEYPTITIPAFHAEELAQVIATLIPGAAGMVRGQANALQIEIFARRDIPTFEREVRVTRQLGFAAGALGVVLLSAQVVAAGNVRRGLRWAGLSLAVAAVATLPVAFLARGWLRGRVPDDAARTILDHVYGSTMTSVLLQVALVLAAGAALAVIGELLGPRRARPARSSAA